MRIFNHSFPFDTLVNRPMASPTWKAAVARELQASPRPMVTAEQPAAPAPGRRLRADRGFEPLPVGGLEHYIDSRLPAGRFRID